MIMNKVYKLLIDAPEYPKDSYVEWNNYQKAYEMYYKNGKYIYDGSDSILLSAEQVENRPHIWELQEEKLDLRSPEAERMREEARSKRWEFVPKNGDIFFVYKVSTKGVFEDVWYFSSSDTAYWNIGSCHSTKEEARLWGEKYARYFLIK